MSRRACSPSVSPGATRAIRAACSPPISRSPASTSSRPATSSAARAPDEIVLSDPGLGIYKKLVIADGRLTGAVLFGDTADGLWYLDLIRSGADIDGVRDDLAFGRAFAERAAPVMQKLAA